MCFMDNEHSAYPAPEEFKVMRPEYTQLSEEPEEWQATITITPFRVTGTSVTKAGARRAALYAAAQVYRSYHPSYRVENPFPDEFVDQEQQQWRRLPPGQRDKLGDYVFISEDGEEDYANIENMLAWDVRPATEDA
jgi:hypothetical protein